MLQIYRAGMGGWAGGWAAALLLLLIGAAACMQADVCMAWHGVHGCGMLCTGSPWSTSAMLTVLTCKAFHKPCMKQLMHFKCCANFFP